MSLRGSAISHAKAGCFVSWHLGTYQKKNNAVLNYPHPMIKLSSSVFQSHEGVSSTHTWCCQLAAFCHCHFDLSSLMMLCFAIEIVIAACHCSLLLSLRSVDGYWGVHFVCNHSLFASGFSMLRRVWLRVLSYCQPCRECLIVVARLLSFCFHIRTLQNLGIVQIPNKYSLFRVHLFGSQVTNSSNSNDFWFSNVWPSANATCGRCGQFSCNANIPDFVWMPPP